MCSDVIRLGNRVFAILKGSKCRKIQAPLPPNGPYSFLFSWLIPKLFFLRALSKELGLFIEVKT